MAKNPFGKLYKVSTSANWATAASGTNLAFGEWAGADGSVYKIYADGITYNIADADVYKKLISDLSTYVHTDVDGSINRLDSSVTGIETWKAALALKVADNKVTIEGVAGEVDFAGKDYVAVTTNASTIEISIDASVKHGKAEEGDDVKLATKGYVDEAVEAAEGDLTDVSNRLADLSTYVYTKVDASIDRLDGSVNLLDASMQAAFKNDDRQDASINAIDSSLSNLYTVVDSSFKAVDSSLKAALKDAALSASATSNVATVTLTTTTEGGVAATDSYTVTGDSYIKVGQTEEDKLTLTLVVADTKQEIADASITDASVATAYAVKEYVKDQISALESALEFKGEITKDTAEELLTTKAASKGDTYVAKGETFTYDNQTIEAGDLVIVKADSAAGTASSIIVIERSQTGIVTNGTAEGGELTANNIVLGNGNDSIKATTYSIGADTSASFGSATKVAVEQAVKQYVDEQDKVYDASMQKVIDASFAAVDASLKADEATVADLSTRVKNASLTVNGDTYVNAKASKADDNFAIDLSINYVDTSAALKAVDASGKLVDALAVKEYIQDAGGQLGAEAGTTTDKDAVIKLTSGTGSDLGKVTIESLDSSLLKVNYSETNKITLDLSIATMADASNGAKGLALAEDVHQEIVNNEQVIAASIDAIKDAAGLTNNLELSDDFKTTFGERDLSEAVIDLSTDLATLSEHVDASIKAMQNSDASVDGQVVVKVAEENGIVTVSHAGVKVNGQSATSDADGNVVVTISGDDEKVGGSDAKWKDVSIDQAIVDLSTAIDKAGSDIKSIEGDTLTVVTGTKAVDDYVAVSASEPDEDGVVTLDSSVLVANVPDTSDLTGYTAATATGLATDAYVKDYVAEELAWNEL